MKNLFNKIDSAYNNVINNITGKNVFSKELIPDYMTVAVITYSFIIVTHIIRNIVY